MDVAVHVVGLKELNKALRGIDRDAPKTLRVALNAVAEQVADKIRPKVPIVSGAAKSSLRVASTRTSARIRAGGGKASHWPWLDFGGEGKRRGRPPARPYIPEGRYIYPTLASERSNIARLLEAALVGVVEANGLDAE
jgi:hypothetical protein